MKGPHEGGAACVFVRACVRVCVSYVVKVSESMMHEGTACLLHSKGQHVYYTPRDSMSITLIK